MRTAMTLSFFACLVLACGSEEGAPGPGAAGPSGDPALPQVEIAEGPHDVVVLSMRGLGDIRIELLPEAAPETVANFLKLAEQGFYDGTQFHRVIPDFMLQGGDPNTKNPDARKWGRGGPGYRIADEFTSLPHTRGIVSMANTGTPNSGGSQFFILHGDARHLDGKHAVFGRVTDGMDVVDAIAALEIDTYGRYGPRNRPYPEPALIEHVRIERVEQDAP